MKIILVAMLLLFFVTSVYAVDYRVMGYYPQTAYGDVIIVYGYYGSNGVLQLSHCRTNQMGREIFSNRTYLDINTCSIRMLSPSGIPAANGISAQ